MLYSTCCRVMVNKALVQRDLVLSKKSYDRVFDRLQKEVVRGETRHLIVLLGVPIAYPRLVWLENL